MDDGESGFTAVLCAAPGCGVGDPGSTAAHAGAVLGAAVAASRHGVLVSTGCLLGAGACRLRPAAPVVLVQPCDAERRPTACVLRVGPLRTAADVDALGRWLRVGRLDPALLPAHLLGVHRRAVAAPSN
jgi:hypothetical protein